jgi:leucyl/phenylalanyl-tRNA--protein transferase
MTSRESAASEITPEVLLRAYACGIFPMAESADDPTLFWVEPEMRGVIPLEGFRVASRLARTVRSDTFRVTVDTAFKAVIAGCAAPQPGRDDTWINKRIRDLYVGLYELGHCHSVEVWQDGDLVGGLYGVSLGRAYFGESMFHRARDASKVALVHLVARLMAGGFELLDTQYVTEHLRSFGAAEIPRRRYRMLLDKAIAGEPADFMRLRPSISGADALAIIASAESSDNPNAAPHHGQGAMAREAVAFAGAPGLAKTSRPAGASILRHCAGVTPIWLLKARWNAASD